MWAVDVGDHGAQSISMGLPGRGVQLGYEVSACLLYIDKVLLLKEDGVRALHDHQ